MGFWNDPIGYIKDHLIGWLVDAIEDSFGSVANWIWNQLKDFADFTGYVISKTARWVKDQWSDFTSFLSWLGTKIGDTIDTAIIGLGSWVKNTWSSFTDFTSWLGTEIDDKIITTFGWLADQIACSWSTFMGFVSFLGSEIDKAISSAIGNVSSWIDDTWKDASSMFMDIWLTFKNLLIAMPDWFVSVLDRFVNMITGDFFKGLNIGIKEAKGSPLHDEELSDNEVLRGLQLYYRERMKE